MPVGEFPNFDACVLHMKGKGHSEEEARKICGAMERDSHMAGSWKMDAMALEFPEVQGHPNRLPFSGVLTQLDTPSDSAPTGAAGHRVVLPSDVAERALPTLLGMAVNFAVSGRDHDFRRKVGVITSAEVSNGELQVAGYLFGKDFPDVVREIRARRGEMGMSYEVTQVRVADEDAEIWVLDNVVFTGAAILEKDAAAFRRTSLAANAGQGGEAMDETQVKKTVMESIKEFFASLGGAEKTPAAGLTEADAKRIAAEAAGVVKTELGAQITALTEENKQLKAAASTGTLEARRTRWNGVVAAASAAGKLVPALVTSLAAQAELAIASTAKVKVKEIQADKSTKEVEVDPLDALIKHVETMPQIVPLGEVAGAQRQIADGQRFNETPELSISAESAALDAAAKKLMKEENISDYGKALQMVRSRTPEGRPHLVGQATAGAA